MKRSLFLLFSLAILAFILMETVDNWYYANHRPKCSDFPSQEDAQKAYNEGNKRLDGDKDGVACESLPPKSEVTNLDLALPG